MSEKLMLKIGGKYNWKNQPERLIYMGENYSGNGYWHQFALVEKPNDVWCECLDSDLVNIEETNDKSELDEVLAALGVTHEFQLSNIKETAMNRFNVPKNRRVHIRKILDDAFNQLKARA